MAAGGDNDTSVVLFNEQCASAVPYSGSVCREELLSMRDCIPGLSLPPQLLVGTNSSITQAQQLVGSLELFASPECVSAAAPLLCGYLFGGVCDSSGVNYLPTAGECLEISTGVCRTEWELARSFGMEILNCSTLPRIRPGVCSDLTSTSGSGMDTQDSKY